ncbi:Phytosulfokines 3 [Hibiscus syriacus]|uniref:Phytosulfokine n=1 Tax=Hibiscus syriacus TaxID=106335 RepID=A0A6A2X8W3_HIBSY|nr:Phytosulfokines 3 [Hibiscus syriacus]
MAKVATFFILTLLLVSTVSFAARFGPASPSQPQAEGLAVETEQSSDGVEDSCDGVGEDECLMRRTLAAHVDYIYTQKHKP